MFTNVVTENKFTKKVTFFKQAKMCRKNRIFHLRFPVLSGGVISLNRYEFWNFCGDNNTLHLDLDTMNDLDEINEENNEAKIENIKVTCDGKLQKKTGKSFFSLWLSPW